MTHVKRMYNSEEIEFLNKTLMPSFKTTIAEIEKPKVSKTIREILRSLKSWKTIKMLETSSKTKNRDNIALNQE